MLRKLSLLPLLAISVFSFGQRGKHLAGTISAANTQVNSYTSLTADVSAGATTIAVANNTLTNAVLTANLGPGDLIMIIQMQGATMDINTTPGAPIASGGWNSGYTLSNSAMADLGNMNNYRADWGAVTAYNNAGNYEVLEVRSVTSTTGITLNCALSNSYTAAGHVQIVRIPRFTSLTLQANTSIIPAPWNGTTGGIVAIEVDGATTFGNNSKISASGFGFRGGVIDAITPYGGPAGSATDMGKPGVTTGGDAAEKGEGIGGSTVEYDALYSRYGLGAPANGGGGGNFRNAGGGGGSNIGTGAYNGKGVPNPTYAASWTLESLTSSSGGGRGGYSLAQTDANEVTVGPNNNAWGGDKRRTEGGLGGHPLTYSASKVFFGGGGGAGEQDASLQGGSGGAGGGLVFLQAYGAVSGTGTIEANGANGQNSNPNNQATSFANPKKGNDGAGGAGAGGAIVISNGTALPNTLTLSANGGNGGNNALLWGGTATGVEADGPGGGGTGGMVVYTSGSPILSTNGGANGVVTASGFTSIVPNFPPNGATSGAAGTTNTKPFFDINASNVTICSNGSTTLTATVVGTLPGPTSSVTWYASQFGGAALGTGLTYTTPVLSSTTTYYVGICPGTFRKPVTVTVGGPTITGTAVVSNATCSSAGSITGLSTSGGAPTVTIQWNGVTTPSMNLSGASAGSYSVLVTDGNGCTATSGPYTINSTGGPTVNTTNMVVTNENCLGNNGSITGITASGTGLTYSWTNSGGSSLNATSLAAGNYTLTVTDNLGCTANAGPITVGLNPGPSINSASVVVTNETCSNSNGSIAGLSASGTGLTFAWTNSAATTLNISSLAAGSYTLTVTNNLGCTATYGPVNITNSPGPVINTTNMVVNNAHCGNNNGSITGITVSGGQPTVTYSWNSGAYSTLNISSLAAGNYTLVASDANGCTSTVGPFTISNIAGPVVNTTGIVITPESCNGNDGSITGITASGASTLTYSWNFVSSPTIDITNLTTGNYALIVTDAFGCFSGAGPFNVSLTAGPTISAAGLVVTNETCSNSNGSIVGLQATGTGLTYEWNGVATFDEDNTGLAAGNYTLVVTDFNGCTVSYGPVNITNSPGPTINTINMVVSNEHCGNANGSITGITISGGQPTIVYSWNSGAYNTLNISSLTAGNYSLLVTDGNGCTASVGPFAIINTPAPTINTTNMVITNESCAGNDGSIGGITVTGTGLSYQWNSVSSPLNINNQTAGNYTLLVTDGFGCTATAGPFTIGASTTLTIDSTNLAITLAGCTVDAGAIEGLAIVGGINPQFNWDNASPTLDNTGLPSGTYTINVSDDQGCNLQASFYVGQTSAPVIDITNVIYDTVHCAQTDGGISGIDVTGGTEPYTYTWDGNAALNTLNISNTVSGNHTLVVVDDMGCQDSQLLVIPAQSGPAINVTNLSVTNSTCQQLNGAIQGITVSGNQPFVYSWTNTSLTSLNLMSIGQGTYTLTVTDAFGCQTTGNPINVTTTPLPMADFSYSPNSIIPNDLVSFNDETTNAIPVTWEWYTDGVPFGVSSTPTYTYIDEGNYVVTLIVTTATGCTDTVSKTLQVFGELIVPNVVTRNNDGANDVFFIKNLKPNAKLVVENRWGSVVYNSDDYQNDWNGDDMEGSKLTEGTYFYQLITDDGKILQGNVYLLNN